MLGCDVIGLQETRRDGTSEIVASRYRVYFSGAKGGKGQHRVGMVIKEVKQKKAGKDGIAIIAFEWHQRTFSEGSNFD